jgi:cytochrome c
MLRSFHSAGEALRTTSLFIPGDFIMKRLAFAAIAAVAFAASAHAEGDAVKGEKVFKKCAACHAADNKTNKVGPHLGDVIGRKPGTVEGYKYSEAMIAYGAGGAVWDEATIDTYLSDPKGTIPKNKMTFAGLKKPEERADVIAFLKSKAAATQ